MSRNGHLEGTAAAAAAASAAKTASAAPAASASAAGSAAASSRGGNRRAGEKIAQGRRARRDPRVDRFRCEVLNDEGAVVIDKQADMIRGVNA